MTTLVRRAGNVDDDQLLGHGHFTLANICPLPWPGTKGSSVRGGTDSSPSIRQHVETTSEVAFETKRWITERYYECMWLGEVHSPIASFVDSLERIARHALDDGSAALLSLLMPSSKMRQRARTILPTHLMSAVSYDSLSLSAYHHSLPSLSSDVCDAEAAAILIALSSGAGSAVAQEMKERIHSSKGHTQVDSSMADESQFSVGEEAGVMTMGPLVKRWLKSIESRELQLQIALTLYLLQHCNEHHTAFTVAVPVSAANSAPTREDQSQRTKIQNDRSQVSMEGDMTFDEGAAEAATGEPRKKRKRKVETARRWTGISHGRNAFPWVPRSGDGQPQVNKSEIEDYKRETIENSTTPEALNKRLDLLADRLCVMQVTASLTLDLNASGRARESQSQAVDSQQSQRQGESQPSEQDSQRPAGGSNTHLHFGSASRNIMRSSLDERDDMQWLCMDVIEPRFGQTLPRQCQAMRAKCFVHTKTPARPRKSTKTDESSTPSRDEVDLATRDKQFEEVRARVAAQDKPMLKEALESEKSRSTVGSKLPAKMDRSKGREVSLRRLSRTSSLGSHQLPARPEPQPSSVFSKTPWPSSNVETTNTSTTSLTKPSARLNKRKFEAQHVSQSSILYHTDLNTLVLATPQSKSDAAKARKAIQDATSSDGSKRGFLRSDSQPALRMHRHGFQDTKDSFTGSSASCASNLRNSGASLPSMCMDEDGSGGCRRDDTSSTEAGHAHTSLSVSQSYDASQGLLPSVVVRPAVPGTNAPSTAIRKGSWSSQSRPIIVLPALASTPPRPRPLGLGRSESQPVHRKLRSDWQDSSSSRADLQSSILAIYGEDDTQPAPANQLLTSASQDTPGKEWAEGQPEEQHEDKQEEEEEVFRPAKRRSISALGYGYAPRLTASAAMKLSRIERENCSSINPSPLLDPSIIPKASGTLATVRPSLPPSTTAPAALPSSSAVPSTSAGSLYPAQPLRRSASARNPFAAQPRSRSPAGRDSDTS